MSFQPIHRVVTGHDENGNAVVTSAGPLATVVELSAVPGMMFHEVWCTSASPALIDNGPDPTAGALTLPPPNHGTRIRFVDFPPEAQQPPAPGNDELRAGFSEIGGTGLSTAAAGSPHPFMHRTQTVDYGIVIEGEVTLVLDRGEVNLKPGSVVVQRGTNHAWANRSGKHCRMLFVLVDAAYEPSIAGVLKRRG